MKEFCINIPTPSPLDDNSAETKSRLKAFYEVHKNEMTVNSIFHYVLENDIHRDGFKFMFWFDTEELAEKFYNEFEGYWVLEGNPKPKTGMRQLDSGAMYCFSSLSRKIDISTIYKFRKETIYGTQVRNSADEEWVFYWDVWRGEFY